MPIDYSALPIQPPAPLPAGATDAQRAEWRDLHRIVATYAHAAAQQATAEAMDRAVVSQQAMADAIAASGGSDGLSQEFVLELIRAIARTPA